MSRFRRSHRPRSLATLDMIPLIDVTFLLLSFFIFITMMMVMQKGIFVNLASAKTGEVAEAEKQSVIVSVSDTGQAYLNKAAVSDRELATKLGERKNADKNTIVYMNADKGSRHGRVIDVLDIARQSGLTQIIFSVEPKK